MMCFNQKFSQGHNIIFRPWTMGYYYPWYGKIDEYFYHLNMNFDDTI